jgi:hypothetical protein
MSNLPETAEWADGIRQFETSDPVEGGPDGVDNIPLRQLANRTSWLRRAMQFALTAFGIDTGQRDAIVVNLLPAVTELVDGMEVTFRVATSIDGPCTFTPNGDPQSGIPALRLLGGDRGPIGNGDLPAGADVRARLNTSLDAAAGGAWVIQSVSGGMAHILTPAKGDASTRAANMAALFAATDGRAVVDVSAAGDIALTASQYGVALLALAGELQASKALVFPAQTGQWIIENNATGNFNITAKVQGSAAAGVVLPIGSPVIVCSDGNAVKFASAGGQAGFRGVPITGINGKTINIVGGYTPGAVMLERNGALQQPGTAAAPDFIATNGTTIELTVAATADEQFNAYVFSTFSVADAVKKSGDAMGGPLALYQGSTTSAPATGDNSQKLINSAWFKAERAAEANQGTAKVATQAQTNAGTDDTTIVTPKKLRAGFSISLGVNGYIAFPSWLGGLIFQWVAATISATANTDMGITAPWPVAFPNALFRSFATVGSVSLNGSGVYAARTNAGVASTTTTAAAGIYTVAAQSVSIQWLAIGN